MNEKIQAILLKIVVQLKGMKWIAAPDWEVTLKGEGHLPLVKQVDVTGEIGGEEWRDSIDTQIDLRLDSEDQLTYFIQYAIYANFSIEGGPTKDVVHKGDTDVAFTERDIKDEAKISLASKKIDRLVTTFIENEYSDYIDQNATNLQQHKTQGTEDDNHHRPLR